MIGALVAATALFVAANEGAGRSDEPVAFVALRPIAGAEQDDTKIEALLEGHALATTGENVLALVAARPVLGSADLRELIGPGYLVRVFDCRGRVPCILKVLAPLQARDVRQALYGEYYVVAGDKYAVRLTLLDLEKGRASEQVAFEVPKAGASDSKAWTKQIARLFSNTGTIHLVTNLTGFTCTLDANKCSLDAEGRIRGVKEGSHVIELRNTGYKDTRVVVKVERGAEVDAVAPMDRLPLQLQEAADPLSSVSRTAGLQKMELDVFGAVQLLVIGDNQDAGLAPDNKALPKAQRDADYQYTALSIPYELGIRFSSPKTAGGWKSTGVLSVGAIRYTLEPSVRRAEIAFEHPDSGFNTSFGLMRNIVFSSQSPGTATLPLLFGNQRLNLFGVRVGQPFGRMLFEAAAGRLAKDSDVEFTFAEGQPSSELPTGGVRIAYIDSERTGRLYGRNLPLTVSISASGGKMELGKGESKFVTDNYPGSAKPQLDERTYYSGSFEWSLPIVKVLMISGEVYYGHGAAPFLGAIAQGPRIELSTGEHLLLDSAGGWVQISSAWGERWETFLLAGHDEVLKGFHFGPPLAISDDVVWNRMGAGGLAVEMIEGVLLRAQVHYIWTHYRDKDLGEPHMWRGLFATQIRF